MNSDPVTAYLGLGSNVGDRMANLEAGLRLLDATGGIRVVNCSSIYETEPWGLTQQPRFLNVTATIETFLEPGGLLAAVKTIENDMGRVTTVRYGPRNIDIDILLFGSLVIDWQTPDLKIPHSRMLERAFVLIPLAEIAGEVLHPATQRPMTKLAQDVQDREGVKLFAPSPQLQSQEDGGSKPVSPA